MYAWWDITGHLNIKCTFTLSAITLLFLWFLEFTTFFFLLNTPAKWTRHIRPAKLTHHFGPAKLTHHSGPTKIDPPLWTRQIDPPLWTCQIDPPIWTRQYTPHSEFPGSPGPADSPPPSPTTPTLMRRRGEGSGGRAGPARASQAGTLLYCPTCKWPTYARAPYIHNVSIFNTGRKSHFKKCSQIYYF